jgi:hypothetical protein
MTEEQTTRTPLTPKERELFDAQADVEAWGFAMSIMTPWFETAQAVGHPELTEGMQAALSLVTERYADAYERLELLERKGS